MTLSTSAGKRTSGPEAAADRKALCGYLAGTAFCIVFSAVYEYFSHQVYSIYMIGMFLFPLLLGAVPVILRRIMKLPPTETWAAELHRWGVITLTFGSCLTGIFQIYGTTSDYTIYYWIAGLALLAAAALSYMKNSFREKTL